jgi:hypothetical protein
VVDDISHGGPRVLLREEVVAFQRLKTWKASKTRFAAKKARVEYLYAIADREVAPGPATGRSCSASIYADPGTMPRLVRRDVNALGGAGFWGRPGWRCSA